MLASSSPRRLLLLAQIGISPVAIIAPEVDETPLKAELPRPYAQRMARAKADAVRSPGRFVLTADTVVAVGRRILPKAATGAEARACIDLLSGRRHHVLTAVTVTAPDGRRAERLSESIVTFARLTEAQKTAWLALGEWEGKAGGYAINGAAASFVRFLSGSFSGVVGLPMFETAQLLRGFGWAIPGYGVPGSVAHDIQAVPDQVAPLTRHPPARPGDPARHGAATDLPAEPGDDGKRINPIGKCSGDPGSDHPGTDHPGTGDPALASP